MEELRNKLQLLEKSLTEIPRDEYLLNDFLCDKCAEIETPEKDAR